ncbi:MAG: pyruvate carboxyltransferase, partial [Proteobacteria bacterium]|nr:pyruvate carboxyltransferase [Pseudomonadota bacterium]
MTSDGAITVLDATLRDGGYLNDWAFTYDEIRRVVVGLDAVGIDVIEVGYASDEPHQPLAAACPVPLLSDLRAAIGRARIAVMMRPDVPDPEGLLDARRDLIDLVRIPTQVLKPEPAIAIARLVEERGIASSINLTSVSAFSDHELRDAVRSIAIAGVESCLYLADSRGAMKPEDVSHAVGLVRDEWPGAVGFHAHDNLGLALENSETALAAGCTWIDGSLNGYGIGGQNTRLSALVELV